jgi:amino acid adenylation domain-containing protein
VGRGDLVPVVMDRDRELPVAVLAVLRAGAAYVPIDPRLPAGRLAVLLGGLRTPGAGGLLALTRPRHAESLDWPEGVTPLPVQAVPAGPDGDPDPPALRAVPGTPADLAYVIHTSGSTGTPKGVMIDHRGALNTVLDVNRRFGVGPSDAVFGVSAFNFDLSVYDLFGPLAAGARLVYPDPDAALDATHWLDLVLREGITVWSSVPALMSLLVETAERRGVTLPALRLALLSGDKIPLDLPAAIRRVAPGAEVVSMGGATEASIWSIVYHPVERIDPEWSTVPYGYPMVHQTWHVLDRTGRPCPTWVPGELCIGGIGLAQGYWNDPAKTARAFVPDPWASGRGGRLYRTGDLGRTLPDGCIEWMGRIDFQVKIQGMRIELGEVEAVLGGHPKVRRAVAAVESSGGRQPRLVAFVVPAEAGDGGGSRSGAETGAGIDPAELEEHLAGLLPAHMVPRAWRVVDALPLTANGKVDRKRLLEGALEEPEPEAGTRRTGTAPGPVPPAGPVERHLHALWREILGIDRIGVLDDFFDLGGQSFDAIRIFARVKEEHGAAFTLGDLWEARTIRALARRIEGGGAERGAGERREDCVVALGGGSGNGRDGAEPLFLVHPAGGSIMGYTRLARALDRPLYGIRAPAGAGGAELRRDVRALARHHAAELRRVRPEGPYTLGGWSSGAMVAFEMAAQLEAAGETVTEVFLLDGPAPFDHGTVDDDRLLRWFLDDLALDLPVDRLNGTGLAGLPLAEQLRTALSRFESPRARELDPDQLAPSFEIFRDLIVAGNRYEPPTISADLTVVRVEEDVVDEFSVHPHREDEAWGWRGFTTGRVRCERVPGTHHSFLRDPLVQGWSSLLAGRT